jgi:hypothetical protein
MNKSHYVQAISDQMRDELWHRILYKAHKQVKEQIGVFCYEEVNAQIFDPIYARVYWQVKRQVYDMVYRTYRL